MDLAPPPADASPAPPPSRVDGNEPPARIVGGVAALVADRLDVDALWVRIAFVLLALVGGVGVLVYAAMWLAFVVGADPHRRWARVIGGTLLVVGVPLALTHGFTFFDGPLAVLALLAGLAVALWQPRSPSAAAPSPPGPLEATAEPAASDAPDPSDAVDPTRWRPRVPRPPKRPARPPSILGRLAIGVALLVGAVGALIDQANGGRLHPEQWLGAAAIVCGIGLAVGVFAGRARWLVVPAAIFAGVGFAAGEAARVGIEPSALVGDESVYIGGGDPGGWRRKEHVVLGSVDISIDGAPRSPVVIDARAAIGEVDVSAAVDVTVEIRAVVDHGDVHVEGLEQPDGTYTVGPAGAPDVVVDARVGRGRINVEQHERVPMDLPPVVPGSRRQIVDEVTLTNDEHLVLAGGEAVLDLDGTVLTGTAVVRDRVTVISTSVGEFQVLPGGLLLTPFGELLDLTALRVARSDEVAPPVDRPAAASTVPTLPTIPVPTSPPGSGG